MTILAKINQTPGLLDTFKLICAESGPGRWLGLTPDEKALFEQYKQQLVQA